MKGISAVLATVLIVVITVAIIGLAYGWATGLFKVTSEATETQVGGVTENLQKSVDIIAAGCDANGVTFTVKNTGTLLIDNEDITIFMNESLIGQTVGDLDIGAVIESTITGIFDSGEHTLKVDAPAGAVEETVMCP